MIQRRNIAYLILAHHQPAHLARLVCRLQSPNVSFFIHIDKKKNLPDFKKQLEESRASVFWVKRRERVYWAGWSMVRATLSLIETARSSGIDFRYFCLLSGDCYPLKKREEIEAIITEGGEEFVQVYRDLRLSQSWVVGRRHFYDMVFLNPRAERSQPDWFLPWNAASILAKKVFKVLERERKYPFSFIPWKGNQFWCLSKECVTYVLSFLKKNSDFVRYHRTTFAPDEVALQTIVCQSEFSKRLARRPLRFGIYKEIDSGREWPFDEMQRQAPNPPERMEGPKILTLSDWKRIEISQALFARKFDEKKSAEVLEKIDRERLGV